MAAVDSLDALLQFLQGLKPPGASPAKIKEITALCIENVQDESGLVQKIFTKFKASPSTHKLGILYVVDSVTRQWMTKATQSGQQLSGPAAAPGTFASGVHKMTEIVPIMMNELLSNYPEAQKERIKKLIDIWDHSNTFSKPMLNTLRTKLDPPAAEGRSDTPPGSPPSNLVAALGLNNSQPSTLPSTAAPSIDPSGILAALSSLGNPAGIGTTNQQPPSQPATNVTGLPYGIPPPPVNPQQLASAQHFAANGINVAGGVNHSAPPAAFTQYPSNGNVNTNPVVPQQPAMPNPANNPMLMQVLQAVISGQIPPDQAAQVLSLLGYAAPPTIPPPAAPQAPAASNAMDIRQPDSYQSPQQDSRQNIQGSSREYPQRFRSRSPDRGGRRNSPPNRRDSPTYGTYDPQAPEHNNRGRQPESDRRGRGRGRGRNEYRQRSPPAQRQQSSGDNSRNFQHNVEFDSTLPKGTIRVLSRTLFVGGVTASEEELRSLFMRFGSVQTCVVNRDKRHAFVKMHNRKDAVTAKQGMENQADPEVQNKVRSTRWGVGFGPRECSDYTTGISVIPIEALTEADRKWVVTAENGGTGGAPIDTGLVIEEPDIEIGAGVSSKAISRRVGPDTNIRGGRGNFNGHRGGFNNHQNGNGHGRGRNKDRHQAERRIPSPRPEPNTIGVPPPVPGFGFQLPGLPMNFG